MSVRWRIALAGSVFFASFAAVAYAVLRGVVFPSFLGLERQEAAEDLARCVEALNREVRSVNDTCVDWARSDDVYECARRRDARPPQACLTAESFAQNRIDLLCLVDLRGKVLWGAVLAPDSGRLAPLSGALRRALLVDSPLVRPQGLGDAVAGLAVADGTPLLIASQPITNTAATQPPIGSLVMGRFVTPALLEQLRHQTRVRFSVVPSHGEHGLMLSDPAPARVHERGDAWTEASTTCPDVWGAPALRIEAQVARNITAHGRTVTRVAMVCVAAAGLIVLALVVAMVKGSVADPIERLTRHITAIRRSGGLFFRLNLRQTDEIGQLAAEFDRLIDDLAAARQELANQAEQLAATLHAVPSALAVLDPALNILSAGERFAELWGLSTPPVGRHLTDCVPQALLQEQSLLERVTRVATHGGEESIRALRFVTDSTVRYLDVRVNGFDTSDVWGVEEARVLLVIEDVTRSQLLEGQLREAAKLEAVGTLAGGVAHDFNNILTGIRCCAEIGLAEGRAQPAVVRELERVKGLAERAASLTRQLLAFGRRQSLRLTPVGLNSLIDGLLVMLRRLAGEHIRLEFLPDPDLPSVAADAAQIEHVVVNLTINARDAMAAGGTLTVRTGRASLGETGGPAGLAPGEYVTLAVADTGVGMDEATRRHLFEPFFTTKEPGKGTGLGLASVYGTVTQHRGAIEVHSEPGRGAEFVVYLPALGVPLPEAALEPVSEPALPPGSGETVLVVEDEVVVREVTCSVLRRNGYEVLAAPDGPQAEAVFEQHGDEVDLLLTDVVMPGYSGRELYQRLAEKRPHLRVLYMSGYAGAAGDAYDVLEPDAEPLRKPFGPDELVRRVQQALAN